MSCNLSERLSKTIPFSSTKIEQKQKRKDLQKKRNNMPLTGPPNRFVAFNATKTGNFRKGSSKY
jgi:hypothetical protein